MKPFIFVFALLVFAGITDSRSSAQESGITDTGLLDAEVLEKTLYAKNSEEKAYCQYVIQQRDNGTLPGKIFYAVYYKAAEKEKPRRFIYFRTGIEILCKREGIVLPVFSATQTKKNFSFVWTNPAEEAGITEAAKAGMTDSRSSSAKKPFSFFSSWFKR